MIRGPIAVSSQQPTPGFVALDSFQGGDGLTSIKGPRKGVANERIASRGRLRWGFYASRPLFIFPGGPTGFASALPRQPLMWPPALSDYLGR